MKILISPSENLLSARSHYYPSEMISLSKVKKYVVPDMATAYGVNTDESKFISGDNEFDFTGPSAVAPTVF